MDTTQFNVLKSLLEQLIHNQKFLTNEEMILTKEDMLSATLEAEFVKSLREGQKGDYTQYLECRIKEYTSELARLAREHKIK